MKFSKMGAEWYSHCPFHADGKRGNFRVNEEKETWYCDVCGFGGSVIDFIARSENKTPVQVMKEFSPEPSKPVNPSDLKLVATYTYTDENGNLLYQALRYDPKTFRQRRPDKGGWAWDMNGVERVLYNLPKIKKSELVFIVEGEKDADNLTKGAIVATTNVGGAGKWLDSYSSVFKNKMVVICGDNDQKGREHVDKILLSLGDIPKSVRILKLPDGFKDVSEFLESKDKKPEAYYELLDMAEKSEVVRGYEKLPIKNMEELELEYEKFATETIKTCFDLSRFLPDLKCVRPLVPGELMFVAADTGVGKTMILQNMAVEARPLDVLVFQMELPKTLDFERFVSISQSMKSSEVYKFYADGKKADWRRSGKLRHINICSQSSLHINRMKELILLSELKIGKRPDLVIVDYFQLLKGDGKTRYERFSNLAEELKVIAKDLNVIMIVASQVIRSHERDSPEIYLHDCKESGSIENSCGVLLGCWRDLEQKDLLRIKVLKNTKGFPGKTVDCWMNGETKIIRQGPKWEPQSE